MAKYVQVYTLKPEEKSGIEKYEREWYEVPDFELETIRALPFYNKDYKSFIMREGTKRILSSKDPNNFDIFPCTYSKTVVCEEKLSCKEVYDWLKGNPKYDSILHSINRAIANYAIENNLPKDDEGYIDYNKKKERDSIDYECLSNPDFNKLFYVSVSPNNGFTLRSTEKENDIILIGDFDPQIQVEFDKSTSKIMTSFYNDFINEDVNNRWLLTILEKYIKFLMDAKSNYRSNEDLFNDFTFEFSSAKSFDDEIKSFNDAIYFWHYLNEPSDERRELVSAFQLHVINKLKAKQAGEGLVNKFVSDNGITSTDQIHIEKYGGVSKKTSETQTTTINANSNTLPNITNQSVEAIIDEIESKIIAQDHVVEAVVANCFANQRIIDTNDDDFISSQKVSILIDGPTGTGKTAICKAVGDKLGVPVHPTSINAYSATGYKGRNLTQLLVDLYNLANGDLDLAQRSIVCLDEFDKLGFNANNTLSMNSEIQRELLTFIEGGKFTIHIGGEEGADGKAITFDTSRLTFIAMGAFTEVRKQKEAEHNKQNKAIGFGIAPTEPTNTKFSYEVTEQDYIDQGLERELIGRFQLLLSTNPLLKEDLKNVLLNSTISPLKTFVDFCAMQGKEVKYDDVFIDEVASAAEQMGFGARGLHKLMSDVRSKLLLSIMTSKEKDVTLIPDLLNVNKHGKKAMGH